jgi:ADP-ribosylation factor family.
LSEFQRLAGATLLVFANKQDIEGALTPEDIKNVSEKATKVKLNKQSKFQVLLNEVSN